MMKLKPSLTLDVAGIIMDTALAYGRDENLLPLTVVVLDAGGKNDCQQKRRRVRYHAV